MAAVRFRIVAHSGLTSAGRCRCGRSRATRNGVSVPLSAAWGSTLVPSASVGFLAARSLSALGFSAIGFSKLLSIQGWPASNSGTGIRSFPPPGRLPGEHAATPTGGTATRELALRSPAPASRPPWPDRAPPAPAWGARQPVSPVTIAIARTVHEAATEFAPAPRAPAESSSRAGSSGRWFTSSRTNSGSVSSSCRRNLATRLARGRAADTASSTTRQPSPTAGAGTRPRQGRSSAAPGSRAPDEDRRPRGENKDARQANHRNQSEGCR